MKKVRVFLDSEVVISSMMSRDGASRILTSGHELFLPVISNFSLQEITCVSERLRISKNVSKEILKSLEVVNIDNSAEGFRGEFSRHVLDINDAHIVGGAVNLNARFLITYNLKHYNLEKIKSDFGIVILSPGSFLQYLRGLDLS